MLTTVLIAIWFFVYGFVGLGWMTVNAKFMPVLSIVIAVLILISSAVPTIISRLRSK